MELSLVKNNQISKAVIKQTAEDYFKSLGELNSEQKLKLLAEIKAAEEYLESLKESLKPNICADDVKLTESVYGAKLQWAPVSTKYDFKDDFEWCNLKAQIDLREGTLKNQIELHEKYISSGVSNGDDFTGIVENGAQVTICKKIQSHGVKITFIK